jgi:hypothetical protein
LTTVSLPAAATLGSTGCLIPQACRNPNNKLLAAMAISLTATAPAPLLVLITPEIKQGCV